MPLLFLFAFAATATLLPGQDTLTLARQGDQALAEHRYPDAEAAYSKLRQLNPAVAEIHAKLGVIFFQQGKFADAVPAFRQALKLKPALPNADVLLSMSLSELGRFGEAVAGLEKGFRRTPDPALKRLSGLQLQRAYTSLRRDADAVQVALEMTRLYPDDPEVLYHSGRLFGNYAYLNMSKLAAVAPDSVFRLLAAGEAHESAGNLELAIARYREVLAQSPSRPGINLRLGRALLRSGNNKQEEAAAAFSRELEIDSTNSNAAYELAEIVRQSGGDKARELFELALRHDASFEEAHIGLAKVLAASGRHADALTHLRQAISLNPASDVAHYQAARSYRAMGNSAEEQKSLAEFKRLRDVAGQRESMLRREATQQQVEAER